VSGEKTEREWLDELTAKFISVTEASSRSGLSPAWVRRLVQRGEIEGVKVGRNWLVSEAALRDYLQQDRRPGPKPTT
jgi:excisionase family DNA binding protein